MNKDSISFEFGDRYMKMDKGVIYRISSIFLNDSGDVNLVIESEVNTDEKIILSSGEFAELIWSGSYTRIK